MADDDPKVASASRIVHATAERIFELIADPSRQPEYDGNDNLASAEPGQRVRAVGDMFTMTLSMGSIRQNHVVEFDEGRLIAWEPSEVGMERPGHLWRWEVEPLDGHHSKVTHTYDWTNLTDPGRFDRARATTSDRLDASIERLAALAEAPWTEDPRLAAVYDLENAGRWDHDFYLALAAELEAETVVDIGCGTGVFVVDLARRGHTGIGVDPADPMLDIARDRSEDLPVEWIHGHADDVPTGVADLVVMMGHVAQYFVGDDEWAQVLDQAHRILRPGGRLTFETRNPATDWDERWTEERTKTTMPHPDGGEFTSWVQVVDKSGPPDSYAMTHHGHTILPDGRHLSASETLRFRSPAEITRSLESAGFAIETTWGDWDGSPFRSDSPELIVLAQRD